MDAGAPGWTGEAGGGEQAAIRREVGRVGDGGTHVEVLLQGGDPEGRSGQLGRIAGGGCVEVHHPVLGQPQGQQPDDGLGHGGPVVRVARAEPVVVALEDDPPVVKHEEAVEDAGPAIVLEGQLAFGRPPEANAVE